MGREKKRETHGITDSASETFQNWNQSVAMVRKKKGQKRPRSRVLQISDRCLALFGYTRKEFEETFQQDYCRLVHPEDRQAFYSSVEDQTAAAGFFMSGTASLPRTGAKHTVWNMGPETIRESLSVHSWI